MTSLDRRREDKESRKLWSLLECHFQSVAGKKRCLVSVVSVCEIILPYLSFMPMSKRWLSFCGICILLCLLFSAGILHCFRSLLGQLTPIIEQTHKQNFKRRKNGFGLWPSFKLFWRGVRGESFKKSPGVLPYNKPCIRYEPPQRVGFLRRFGLKTGLDFAQLGLESGMVFEETTGVYAP